MANVNDFVGRLAGGGARSNQFQVVVSPPAANPAGIPAPGLTFMFLCRSAQIPASTIGEVLVPFRGRQIFLAGDRTYDAWTVTVFSDTNWDVRSTVESWQNAMQDIGASTTAGAASSEHYYGRANVTQLDRNDRPLREYVLHDIWPMSVDPIDLGYDTDNIVQEFSVSWRFNYMTSGAIGSSS